jgi:quercetin dioxygenase-like cupin family protein
MSTSGGTALRIQYYCTVTAIYPAAIIYLLNNIHTSKRKIKMETLKEPLYRSYQGGYFRSLVTPEQTGNLFSLLEFTLPKGAEPPPHIHTNEDESFYVLDGELSVTIGDRCTRLRKGDALFAPRHISHSFKIVTDKAVFINLITPGALWNYFIAFSEPLESLPQTLTAPQAPSPERLKAMLDATTNIYQINFK